MRTVNARLLKFKREGGRDGDQDFHLVMTDDTLQFSPGGSTSKPSPHSFVAEVVNPKLHRRRQGSEPNPQRLHLPAPGGVGGLPRAVSEHLRRLE